MKLEVGKYYKTRDGRKVGPMQRWCDQYTADHDGTGRLWYDDGTHGAYSIDNKPHYDLISEWPSDGPVRTVTRREVVPGVYGILSVYADMSCIVDPGDPTEFRAAAATLIEIADALEDGK